MRILAIGAHPDDLEILAAGTLARYVKEGHEVIAAHASVGDKGHAEIPHHEVAVTRRQEARSAAEVIGAESVTLGFRDGEIELSDENRRAVTDLIRETRPDVLLTHDPDDYHGDHRAVTQMVLDASFMATVPYYVTRNPAHPLACPTYFIDTLGAIDFDPTDYVDITDTIDLKKRAMQAHASQVTWLREHHHTDILDFIDTIGRFRGLQCGVGFAEGFRRFRAWGRLTTRRLLPG